ncbi:prepilin peptidase [Planosporangium sp. 12N6]|uniref:prepilin peptidase n=1 Tax=Planosporangium spinosum TaxID=3402278 RepID=UPI003CF99534
MAGLIGGLLPLSPALPAFWIFAVLGVGLAIIDVRQRRLPHALTGTLWATSVLCFATTATLTGNVSPLLRALIAGLVASTALLIVALALPGQLGLGDVTLAGAITLNLGWLSWQATATGFLGGLVIQGFVGLAAKVRTRSNNAVPMGPALVAGWLAGLLLLQAH